MKNRCFGAVPVAFGSRGNSLGRDPRERFDALRLGGFEIAARFRHLGQELIDSIVAEVLLAPRKAPIVANQHFDLRLMAFHSFLTAANAASTRRTSASPASVSAGGRIDQIGMAPCSFQKLDPVFQ